MAATKDSSQKRKRCFLFFSNKMVGSESALMSPVRQELISSETKTKAQSVCKSCQILPSRAGWASTVVKTWHHSNHQINKVARDGIWWPVVWVRKRSWLITRLLCIQMYEGKRVKMETQKNEEGETLRFPSAMMWQCPVSLYLANEQPFFFCPYKHKRFTQDNNNSECFHRNSKPS